MNGIKGAYWSPMLDNKPNIKPENISQTLFTHLFYASVLPNPAKNYVLNIDNDAESMRNFTDTIKKRGKQTSFLSIGKRNENPNKPDSNSAIFSNMASNKENRENFIRSSINVAKDYGFNGLDLDWEFPTKEDMKNLSLLLQEWREAIDKDSPSNESRLFLSAAVYYANDEKAYPIEDINRYVDYCAPRCYDYHGNWDTSATAEHSCLRDPNHPKLNTEYGIISTWIGPGHLPAGKLVMGLPLFGKTWTLEDPVDHGVGAPATDVGTGHNGFMRYDEIVKYNTEKNAKVEYDKETRSTYSHAEYNWIGYDNEKIIQMKVQFAKNNGLGGYFLWALGYDNSDFLAKTASDEWDGIAAKH